MNGFSDVKSSNDAGLETKEAENPNSDFGDGDGVNEFDDIYENMNNSNEIMDYSEKTPDTSSDKDNAEKNLSNMSTDESVDAALSNFDDSKDKILENNVSDENNSQNNSDSSNISNNDKLDSNNNSKYDQKNAKFENVVYQQGNNDFGISGTCGPTSVANSLNRVTNSKEYTENKVLHDAMNNNLCYKDGGTNTRQIVNIIDCVKSPESNIHAEVYAYDKALSVDDLAKRLDNSGTVAIVGVDSATLWDQRGDIACSGLFQHTDSPSDHWITVDSPIKDESGNLRGFNVIDSGGGISEISREKFESMYKGNANHTVLDPTAILISNSDEGDNLI